MKKALVIGCSVILILTFIFVSTWTGHLYLPYWFNRATQEGVLEESLSTQKMYSYGALVYVNPLSSFHPLEEAMPYFTINEDKFGIVGRVYDDESHTLFNMVENPIYEQQPFNTKLFSHKELLPTDRLKIEALFAKYARISLYVVLEQDKAQSDYYLLFAGDDVFVAYKPDTIQCWIVSVTPQTT